MARSYMIGGLRFYRRSLVRLDAAARSALDVERVVVVDFPVQYPLAGLIPDFSRATVDAGGTEIWGPGPYLKVPGRYLDATDDEWQPINRIFCPWGYPPDRLRVAHRPRYVFIDKVELLRSDPTWTWRLTLSRDNPSTSADPAGRRA